MKIGDVWDIPFGHASAKEKAWHPTEKPVELLKRIVECASKQGDTVLDPFCGSGAMLATAEALGRRWVGMDINPDAKAVVEKKRIQIAGSLLMGEVEHGEDLRLPLLRRQERASRLHLAIIPA